MLKKDFKIKNELGLHARAAALFVKSANKFSSDIFVAKNDMKVNAKSIMGIMALGVSKSANITIITDGIDEEEAMKELENLIEVELLEL